MVSFSATKTPSEIGNNAWQSINTSPYKSIVLEDNINADWLIIGGGFAGLSAANRLTQLRPNDKTVVIDALRIGEGSTGQNSGFMIDLPHNISSSGSYTSTLDKDRQTIALHRHAIQYAKSMADQFNIPFQDFMQVGKINAAATLKSEKLNKQYQNHLDQLKEPYELLDDLSMYKFTGSPYYRSGLFTPGTILLHPVNFIRSITTHLRKKISIFDQSPALSLIKQQNSWKVKTPKGVINAANVIFAINGHIQNFGFFKNRLIHLFTYAAVTKKIQNDQITGKDYWGITSANPLGTTLRKIQDESGYRLLIRNQWQCQQSMQIDTQDLHNKTKQLRASFNRRFPKLRELDFEFAWAGRVCLSLNNVPAFGELENQLYSACCSNGLGSINGTLAGKFIVDQLCHSNDLTYKNFQNADKPSLLPPNMLTQIGANINIKSKEWLAGKDL